MVMTEDNPTTTGAASGGTLRERIQPHIAGLEERAQATEDARSIPVENIQAIVDAGFARAFTPSEYGGDERDMWDYVDGIRAVAKACPSTGWVTGVMNVHQSVVVHFTNEIKDQVWGNDPDTLISSSGTAVMKAELAEGGVIVNGKGRWSSGCEHAEYALVGIKVPDIGDSIPMRRHRPAMFLAHKSEYTIEDVWHTEAMKGTGSNNLVFDNLFVSSERLEALDALSFGYAKGIGASPKWFGKLPMPIHFSCFFPAVALGCADGMIEEFTMRTKMRKNAYTEAAGVLNPGLQMRLAEAVHEIEALTAYYRVQMDEMQQFGMSDERLTDAQWHRMLQRLPYISDRALKVVENLFVGAGSSAIASGGKMQRYWRDAHACRMHAGMDYDSSLMHHGRNMLGLGMTPDL
jgi:alkylation response protein AidB-like acyl-CoA dehydrogenase